MIKWALFAGLALAGASAFSQDLGLDEARVEWRAFRSLPKPDQRRIHKIYSDFEKLSPSAQAETREWVQRWLGLSLEERAKVRHRLQRWERMSPEEKQELQKRWRALADREPES
ncbi:MAG TPA: DUF3106 domain-containing protein [Pseudobdellovibrionaceae bacterium]|nr:DUF3106 domain-containing protein [Pseudobdellovibrionaceae bacterium]